MYNETRGLVNSTVIPQENKRMLDASKKREITERVRRLEDDIAKAREYLETGAHSKWHKFQPLFNRKVKDGKALPPHKDWVRNVFLPNLEKALSEAENVLDRDGQFKVER